MKNAFGALSLLILSLSAFGQTRTITPTGVGAAWNVASNWNGNNIADNVNEDVDFSGNNKGEVLVQNGDTYTVGHVDLKQGNTLTIENGGILIVGFVLQRNVTTDNNAVINVEGNLTINGNLDVWNNLELNVPGTLIINGNVTLNNNSDLDISGNAIINGDLNGGENTDANVDGSLWITGDINVGNQSDLTGGGNIILDGGCTDDGSGSFCNSGPLPVELLHFVAKSNQGSILLNWATAAEINNNFFTLERSRNGIEFEFLGQIDGKGTTTVETIYEFEDRLPFLGISYYRLSQTDFDGTTEVFPVISVVHNPTEDNLQISPNPISGNEFRVKLSGFEKNEVLTLRFIDLQGKIIENKQLVSDYYGNLDTVLQIREKIQPGTYLLNVSAPSKNEYSRVVVK